MKELSAHFFFRGLIIGFSIAAPVGPIGVLCIRRTMAEGRLAGFISGLGAATADALYGYVAAFGLTLVSSILIEQHVWLRLGGGVFLCVLGLKTFLHSMIEQAPSDKGLRLAGAYASTFFLTLTNPLTILSFTAIFAGLGVGTESRDIVVAGAMVLGVFVGSALWWLILSQLAGLSLRKLGARLLQWVNRISGMIITAFGLMALFSLFEKG